MEKVIRIFTSFADADADAVEVEEDLEMPPERRISIVLELQERMYPNASQQRLARVHRITQLERS
jgi:hypothetical protein